MTEDQTKLDKMLGRGIALSIFWMAGFGSGIALYEGLNARRMIKANPLLKGIRRAWWCIIAGGAGFAVLVAVILIGIFNAIAQP